VHPLVRASVLVALWTAAGTLDPGPAAGGPAVVSAGKARDVALVAGESGASGTRPALCGAGTLPEGEVCVTLPPPGREGDVAETQAPESNQHPRLRGGGLESYDQIPKLPDRAENFGAYVLPIGKPGDAPKIASGYDLDRPSNDQRHGAGFKAYGHGGVDLIAERGTEVRGVVLDHQEGDGEVLFVGEMFGLTVVTAHAVREKDRLRSVLVLYGHLERAAPGLAPHAKVVAGSPIGAVGDSGSPGLIHLHLETRQVRDGVNLATIDPKRVLDQSVSVATDPRNVLTPSK
jgi:murein DD-endopeptidase MepM/ murein hydrolase activator NlpD